MKEWKRLDREWREGMKRQLQLGDEGRESEVLNRGISADAMVILEANSMHPFMIRNHLGFYDMGAAIENTRHALHLKLAEERALSKDTPSAIEHLMEAQNALAACNLLRDLELLRQVELHGRDVVVFRDLNHIFLSDLEGKDMPVVLDPLTVVNFSDIVKRKGVNIIPVIEDVELTYSERAVNMICSGGIDPEEHAALALKQILLEAFLTAKGRDPIMMDEAFKHVEKRYEELAQMAASMPHLINDVFP